MSIQNQKLHWSAWLLLIAAGLVAFGPSVSFDFVNWDDPAYIAHNSLIKSWSPANLAGIATQTVTRNYAPITIFSFLIDHTIWGMNPVGYHATNVLLHILNGLLVLVLVRQITGSRFVGWMAAALFLVHPVQIETVAWISSRKGILSATFMLAALIVRLKKEPDATADLWYIAFLCAALLSKALAVVLPAIVLGWDLWLRRQKFAEAVPRQIIPGLLCLLLLLKTIASQNSVMGGVRGHMEFTLWKIIGIDATILWTYIRMLLWPSDLCVLYDPPVNDIWMSVIAGSAAWIAIFAFVWRKRESSPQLLWAGFTFFILLFPVLNFFRITTLMNDRYLYLPSIIAFAVVSAGLENLFFATDLRKDWSFGQMASRSRWLVAGTTVAVAAAATAAHLPVWQNPESLWTHAMKQNSQIPVVRIQMALTKYDNGQKREAINILEQALDQTDPDQQDRERIQNFLEEWTLELAGQPKQRV